MKKDQLNMILKDFGKNLGIPDLSFDENNYCCLLFDDFVVNLETAHDGEILYFYANVGEIPSTDRESFYEMLLNANFLFSQTNGATLGISKEANFVLLSYQINISGLDLTGFTRIVENFVNTVEMWSKRIATFGIGERTSSEESEEMAMGLRV